MLVTQILSVFNGIRVSCSDCNHRWALSPKSANCWIVPDRMCQPVSDCLEGLREVSPATATSDRGIFYVWSISKVALACNVEESSIKGNATHLMISSSIIIFNTPIFRQEIGGCSKPTIFQRDKTLVFCADEIVLTSTTTSHAQTPINCTQPRMIQTSATTLLLCAPKEIILQTNLLPLS